MISKTTESSQRLAAVQGLLSAEAVRARAQALLALARADRLQDWLLDEAAMPGVADYVCTVVRERYPRSSPPPHARWRHFVFDGRDLWREIAARHRWPDAASRARAEIDLAIMSVLLDAGADPRWRFADAASGIRIGRSEGLALASLRMFEAGAFSAHPDQPLRVDAVRLRDLDPTLLARSLQVDEDNPFPGIESRAALLNRLGDELQLLPDWFARNDEPRPGGLFDALAARAHGDRLPAEQVLEALLYSLGGIWRGRPLLDAVPLGDCWPHPALGSGDVGDPASYVPLHKLSQWLAYSLIEPLERAGITIVESDALTGLAEYRNGGLFVDLGVLRPRDPRLLADTHAVDSPLVVGWRGLTVALLDLLAPLVRTRLAVDASRFPLASLLEGGTWAAGRRIAAERRAEGGPPIRIFSDGTVF